jgi:hypothetical protein
VAIRVSESGRSGVSAIRDVTLALLCAALWFSLSPHVPAIIIPLVPLAVLGFLFQVDLWAMSAPPPLTSQPQEPNLVESIISIVNGWIVATFGFGVSLWGTVSEKVMSGPYGEVQRIESAKDTLPILSAKIGAYSVVSLVLVCILCWIIRMSAKGLTRAVAWTSLVIISAATIGGILLAADHYFPGQVASRAEDYRFQVDGTEGFRVFEPMIFPFDAHDLDLIATIHPTLNENWELVGAIGYRGGRQSVDKPDLQMQPIPSLEDDPPRNEKKNRSVLLHDIKKDTQYTLVFRFHVRKGREGKTTPKDALTFLKEYPSSFAVTIDRDTTPP